MAFLDSRSNTHGSIKHLLASDNIALFSIFNAEGDQADYIMPIIAVQEGRTAAATSSKHMTIELEAVKPHSERVQFYCPYSTCPARN